MESYVRWFLMCCLGAMMLSIAAVTWNTARYIVWQAYEPRYIQVPVIIRHTEAPSPEETAPSKYDQPALPSRASSS